ncbi:MotA/TolQ/ExbB proton channel family protein [Desulfovibrio sp. JC010]|uniref:MotA/TolQ/ExbB proton channel family protein n=1 Tax=Desulfovibrio sp. JC010 TaxID=2593641 RepID=UPI0013D8B656|nr:MotA/TolQ/ExbB proton channel family protein [Desulfovibrio sp. JC010]NDV26020.1 flagellar motor protein MotA [Desulfovibrio sp. JC010]
MKKYILALLAILILVTSAQAANTNTKPRIDTDNLQAAKQEARQTELIITEQKIAITQEAAALKKSIAGKKETLGTLKTQYEALLAEEKKLKEELAEQAHELKTIDGAIRTSAKQARDYFNESLTTPDHPERLPVLEAILKPNRFPGMESIKQLLNLYLHEMHTGGEILHKTTEFTAKDGQSRNGETIRIGTFTTVFRTPDGELGFLRPDLGGAGLTAVAGEPGWMLSRTINDFFDGKSNLFPVDISNGAALQRIAQTQKSFTEWLSAGGILVWPILLVGLIAALIIIERFISLSRIRANSGKNMGRIIEMVSSGKCSECREFCLQKSSFPTCRVISHTLKYAGTSKEILENAFQEGLLKELPLLERFLPTLNVLAAVAPLLGLLGTVTGMINTFQIITIYGTGDPRMMSGGISEALVTTQLGLAVAVPIMLLHHILDRRVDKIVGDMEEKGATIAVALMKKNPATGKGTVYGDAA